MVTATISASGLLQFMSTSIRVNELAGMARNDWVVSPSRA